MVTRIAGRVLGCCAVALLLHLTCVSAVQKLYNINDLRNIQFGWSVPRHSLKLLHWFANTVWVCNNWIQPSFDPNSDYGAHHYGNYDMLLPHPPAGYRYYTVGNLDRPGAEELPFYVQHDDGSNRARVIFSVHGQSIGRVYITQHQNSNQGSSYDPDHIYEICPDLLRELRQLSPDGLDQFYTERYQMQSLLRNPAHHTHSRATATVVQSQGTDSILDIGKCIFQWTFILIVMMALFIIIIIALDGKFPHRH
ncbi:uncharacterized protein LOC142886915 [Nelusetta ayraudi]|uniref:uncharacterized protein LOC142886915 n=1 Tax=Nelusetta ayraudi TaxID=303726 RepID=UPI003F6EC51C